MLVIIAHLRNLVNPDLISKHDMVNKKMSFSFL